MYFAPGPPSESIFVGSLVIAIPPTERNGKSIFINLLHNASCDLGSLQSATAYTAILDALMFPLVIKVVPVAVSRRAINDTESRSWYDLEPAQRLQNRLDSQRRL